MAAWATDKLAGAGRIFDRKAAASTVRNHEVGAFVIDQDEARTVADDIGLAAVSDSVRLSAGRGNRHAKQFHGVVSLGKSLRTLSNGSNFRKRPSGVAQ